MLGDLSATKTTKHDRRVFGVAWISKVQIKTFPKARHSRSYYSLVYTELGEIHMPCIQLFPIYSRINENRIRLQSNCLRAVSKRSL